MPALMLRCLQIWLLALCLLASSTAGAQDDPFAVPPGLESAVNFWTRIYTESASTGGLIHDDEHLEVVYSALDFPAGTLPTARSKRIEDEKQRIVAALRKLATQRTQSTANLSASEQQVRDAWPGDTPLSEFAAAAERVRFQLGQADRFREGLIRSGAWREEIRRIFSDAGLPAEIAALPHVESSFNTSAYSRVGAAGMWQFMRSTGKRFLRIDKVVDERLDPYKASMAAASFMQQNFAVLQSWPLAITAYNHGAGGMLRARNQLGSDDIVTIIRHYDGKTFGFASRNFYACFLAALQIDRAPDKYFPGIQLHSADHSRVLTTQNFISMPAFINSTRLDSTTLRQLNPALLAPVWTGAKRVPAGFELRLPAQGTQLALNNLPAAAQARTQVADLSHRVRGGETLSTIAQRYGIGAGKLASLNGLRKPYRVHAGQVLMLPVSGAATLAASVSVPVPALPVAPTVAAEAAEETESSPASARDNNNNNNGNAEPVTESEAEAVSPTLLPGVEASASADPADYRVHAGNTIHVEAAETLSHYADWLEINASRLRQLNKLRNNMMVSIGRRLKLDFSHVTVEQFVARRTGYHQQLQDAFFAQYRIVGSDSHTLRKGESIWVLSQKIYNIPAWLLRQYNPDLDLGTVRPGTKLVIPRVKLITDMATEDPPA